MVDMTKREMPKEYIERAIKIVKEMFDPYILEIGCCRQELRHDVDKEICAACCDGHSTYLWARTGWNVVSVDINPDYIETAKKICAGFDNVSFIVADAIKYVETIGACNYDLIFLDAWDLDSSQSAENHLNFYNKIKNKFRKKPMILIDDTDIYYDKERKEYFYDDECLSGKGKLLIPGLLKTGYEIVFKGRQTLLREK